MAQVPPQPAAKKQDLVGDMLSIVTKNQLRYEGRCTDCNTVTRSITLVQVILHGTENRPVDVFVGRYPDILAQITITKDQIQTATRHTTEDSLGKTVPPNPSQIASQQATPASVASQTTAAPTATPSQQQQQQNNDNTNTNNNKDDDEFDLDVSRAKAAELQKPANIQPVEKVYDKNRDFFDQTTALHGSSRSRNDVDAFGSDSAQFNRQMRSRNNNNNQQQNRRPYNNNNNNGGYRQNYNNNKSSERGTFHSTEFFSADQPQERRQNKPWNDNNNKQRSYNNNSTFNNNKPSTRPWDRPTQNE